MSSLYNALFTDQDYAELVSEYWRTIDEVIIEVPRLRIAATALQKSNADPSLLVKMDEAVGTLHRVTLLLRPAQERVLVDCIGSRAETIAQYDVAKGHTDETVSKNAFAISSTLKTFNGVPNFNSPSIAMGAAIWYQSGCKR